MMAEQFVWIFSGAVSLCGLLCVALYAWTVTRPEAARSTWWDRLDTLDGVLRRRRRRHLGMAIVTRVHEAYGTIEEDEIRELEREP